MTAASQPVDTGDRLSFTLFLAVALHALLILGVGFTLEQKSDTSPTLLVTLANHKADKAPQQADFIAQHNQEASGTKLKNKELTTEQRADFAAPLIRDINPRPQVRERKHSEQRQLQQITSTHNKQKTNLQLDANHSPKQQQREGEAVDSPPLSAEISSLQAKLDRQRQAYAKRPRVRRLTSVATKASFDAKYLQQWTSKIEFVGNRNFPQQALLEKTFGDLRLITIIKPNGTIERVELLESSGHPILDSAALQIAHLASPFSPFPPEIRKEYDQLEIIRTWRFEISGLSTMN